MLVTDQLSPSLLNHLLSHQNLTSSLHQLVIDMLVPSLLNHLQIRNSSSLYQLVMLLPSALNHQLNSSSLHQPSKPVEPSPSLNYSIPGRSSNQMNSLEPPQPLSARVVVRPNLRVKTGPMVPSSMSLSLKRVSSVSPADSQLDKVKDKRLFLDFGTFKLKEQASDGLEERERVLKEKEDLTNRVDVESMLMVEKDEGKLPAESNYSETFGLSLDECEDVLLKQINDHMVWLIESNMLIFVVFKALYFWRRAKTLGLEPDIADYRLQFWINQENRLPNSHDAVDGTLSVSPPPM
ncbi:hypothetical protein SASPL_141912 [Salvia splendens]|uniref:Uncharacterized protein n=1 Tax=Salvia splendens TaxID=180675 RepID=A0A8X8WJA0_SALSN|nr:hypothetical protein SASPL_141912 [Salvia splendens]